MAAWIALFVSTISLLVTIIVQRDELAKAIKDLRVWNRGRELRIKAEQTIAKFDIEPKTQKAKRTKAPLNRIFLIVFLPLVICSGVASILNIKTLEGMTTIGAILFTLLFIVGFIIDVIEEIKAKTMKWYYWIGLILLIASGSAIFGVVWGGIALLFMKTGLPILWAGIVSAIIFPIHMWAGQYYIPPANA